MLPSKRCWRENVPAPLLHKRNNPMKNAAISFADGGVLSFVLEFMPAVGAEFGKIPILRFPAAVGTGCDGGRFFGPAVGTEIALVFRPAFWAGPAVGFRSLFPTVGAELPLVFLAAAGADPTSLRRPFAGHRRPGGGGSRLGRRNGALAAGPSDTSDRDWLPRPAGQSPCPKNQSWPRQNCWRAVSMALA